MRFEIRIAGEGGQGIILASVILAEAAGIYEGKNVVQSQVYGAAARGEISKADVIISDKEIFYPEVSNPDILIALTGQSYKNYSKDVKENGIIIVDSFFVRDCKLNDSVIALPLLEVAKNTTGKKISMNIVSLGALSAIAKCVYIESLENVIKRRFAGKALEENLKALNEGYKLQKLV